ncbi:MAG: hypothetical protein WCF17_12000 [Terracidiphilus sp.]
MSEPEDFKLDEVYLAHGFRAETVHSESSTGEFGSRGNPLQGNEHEPLSRVMGSPLPMGSGSGLSQDAQSARPAPPPGRALSPVVADDSSPSQRAMGLLKQAVPFVQKLLPLIDGNFASAIANLLSPHSHPSGPPPSVDLTPVQNQISDLQMQHNELRSTVQEQTTGIKRVEDQLEMVREATDRNTLEQQELIEDLKNMGNKVNLFAVTLSALLLLSLVLNVILYLHIKRVLP